MPQAINSTDRPPPYPPDTRPKGWRLQLDYERINQSDTWALAAHHERPWLLMLWHTAWSRTPCGAMPNDWDLIRAHIGLPPESAGSPTVVRRDILLRGWFGANDGRIYHPVIAEQVLALAEMRTKEAKRKADFRASQAPKQPAKSEAPYKDQELASKCPTGQPRDTHWTPLGVRTPEPEPEPEPDPFISTTNVVEGTPAKRTKAAKPKIIIARPELLALGINEDDLDSWLARRGSRSPVTKAVIADQQREAAAAGLTLPQAIAYAAGKGWISFNAGYYANARKAGQAAKPAREELAKKKMDAWFGDSGIGKIQRGEDQGVIDV